MFLEKNIEDEKLFNFLAKRLKKNNFYDKELNTKISEYLSAYSLFNSLSWERIQSIYLLFIKTFNDDVKEFKKTNKFPLQLQSQQRQIGREDYDIILLMSVLLTSHRHRIMSLIKRIEYYFQNVLVIGCGPGFEIELIKNKAKSITAYDLDISEFVKNQHTAVVLNESYFEGVALEKADAIFLIEILEHLEEPYKLISDCFKMLSDNGKIFLTTATNVPQFDHRYNFEPDHLEFEGRIHEIGLKINYREEIMHNYITVVIDAKNTYYELVKV